MQIDVCSVSDNKVSNCPYCMHIIRNKGMEVPFYTIEMALGDKESLNSQIRVSLKVIFF
jgi:hypothetical protein